ncbi:MAG: 3-oxoacyl-ACP reductase family protein [Pseudomonadota bacterium]|nr:3-oxoacyl-ACP reductase family protein [Pseudomonadota bacterium]
MLRLKDRVSIITGGSQGIGAAYVREFVAEGARVVIADVVPADKLIKKVEGLGSEPMFVKTDVTDEAAVQNMVEKTLDKFGGIDVLVNNAALWVHVPAKPILEIEKTEWDQILDVNINGTFLCTKAVVPHMQKRGYGKIINISSGRALKGQTNLLHYDTSKGAVISFTRSIARELGVDGIRANTIAPGGVMTDAVLAQDNVRNHIAMGTETRAIKREQVPDDVVGACVFLASAESDFITGQLLAVDGGSAMN